MKKFASIGLGLLLVFTMAAFVVGCGGAPADKGTAEPAAAPAPSETAAEPMEEAAPAMEETTPDSAAPADATEPMTEEPAAQEEAAATESGEETAADSGEALTDEFDDFDYSVGGGAASKRR